MIILPISEMGFETKLLMAALDISKMIYETENNLAYSTHILHYICAKKEICEFGKVLFIASKIDKVGFMAFG